MKNRAPRKPADFPYALKSFLGYLEGTRKSAHTIKNYRLDLLAFQDFLTRGLGDRPVQLEKLGQDDVERFHQHLRKLGLKTNTRRRKLLTVRRFLSYLVGRNKLPEELGRKIPTPHKVERIPLTVRSSDLIAAIRALPAETLLDLRNRALLWALAETGCLVSEVTQLRFEDWSRGKGGGSLRIGGSRAPRELPVSTELFDAVQALRERSGESPWLFLGFNKFGALGGSITPRGVEMLVRLYAGRLGVPELTPRTFRHSVVIHWFKQGLAQDEIQKRLGLRTPYAFRAYAPLLKAEAPLPE